VKAIFIHGWMKGFQKVEFTTMLRRELGYPLSKAKSITDAILANEPLELPVPEDNHEPLLKLITALGAKAVGDPGKKSPD
jgi:hypothetical protein